MCDYSLTVQQTRLANSGEDLMTYRFPGGSVGLAAAADVERISPPAPLVVHRSWWRNFWEALCCDVNPARTIPAVCVPPGARLIVSGLPPVLQREFGCGETEAVVFDMLSPHAEAYRDCFVFRTGKRQLLQRLPVGLRVHVLSVDSREPNPASQTAGWAAKQMGTRLPAEPPRAIAVDQDRT